MNSDMVNPDKIGCLYVVYHFTVLSQVNQPLYLTRGYIIMLMVCVVVCLCVCVSVFVCLYSSIVKTSSNCLMSKTCLKVANQRSCVVNIHLGASGKFLHLYL